MKDKYSQAKREQYGRRLAAHLCDQHFATAPQAPLDGPAVLKFAPIRQVNLFVARQLLGQWTQEMAQLRSPYFNFEAPEVRQGLTQFMNLVSRHIQLRRAAFESLLARAIGDTLGVAAEPAATLAEKLLGEQATVPVPQLRDALRYFDVNKPLYQGFVDSLPAEETLERAQVIERFRQYQQTHYTQQQPLDKLVAEFSALLPLTVADLLEDGPVAAPAAELPPRPAVAKPAPPVAAVAAEPQPAAAPPPAPPRPTPAPVAEPVGANPRLYEKLKSENTPAPSLSQTLRPERPAASLAEKPPRVESLREAISINQRFSFINELFGGENMEYHAAIQHLDTLPNAAAAKAYVTGELASQHDWTRKDEHVQRLLKLIDRKFAL